MRVLATRCRAPGVPWLRASLGALLLLGGLAACGSSDPEAQDARWFPSVGPTSTVAPASAPDNPSREPSGYASGEPFGYASSDPAGQDPDAAEDGIDKRREPIQEPPGPPPRPGLPTTSAGVVCPPGGTTVRNADGLARALRAARPGQTIKLADGTYPGKFVATISGTVNNPIFLCGGPGAVLDGEGVRGGYVLHLDGASWWRLVGFTVRNGQKGVVLDNAQHAVVQRLTVTQIGDEAIHLRSASSDGLVIGNQISDTGLRRDKFGEGVYIGSAVSNWCTYTGCRADRSDRNVIRNNVITGTTAEAVDIKEGTTGGAVVGNTFDGSMLTGADSWVDVKGNGWLISENSGRASAVDGFQTHQVADGWGTGNLFTANTADLGEGSGWGFHLAPALANEVACDNRVTGAGAGPANVECR